MRLYKLVCFICLSTFALAACAGTALHVGLPQNENSPNQNDKSDQTLYSLDLQHPEITQKIQPEDSDPAKARFVVVEVINVINPEKRPAEFEVHYQPNDGEKILIGGFSLYPPDNPGKFIVSTQGKVKAEGQLILSLVKSDRIVAGDVIKVTIRPMKFISGKSQL